MCVTYIYIALATLLEDLVLGVELVPAAAAGDHRIEGRGVEVRHRVRPRWARKDADDDNIH